MISISNNFATLESYDPVTEMLRFRFSYSIDVAEAFRSNARKIRVSVYKNSFAKSPIVPNQYSTVSEHLSYQAEVKNYASSLSSLLIVSGMDDLTAYVDNSALSRGNNKLLASKRKKILVPNSTLNLTGGQVESFTPTSSSNSVALSSQSLSLDLINKLGIDPSEVSNLRTSTYEPNSHLNKLANLFNSNNANEYLYSVVTQEDSSNIVESYVEVIFSRFDFDSGETAVILYELIDDAGISVSSSTQTLNFASFLSTYKLPHKPPVAKFASNSMSKFSTLNIRQVDEVADQVVVYYKEFGGLGNSKYSLLKEVNVKSGDEVSINVLTPSHHPTIYRIIPKNSEANLLSFEYQNVVLMPRCYTENNEVSLSASINDSGTEIEATQIPTTTSVVKLLKKNRTLHDKNWSTVNSVNNPVVISDTSPQRSYKFFDVDVISGHLYEYTAELQYNSGISKKCGSELIEYVPKTAGIARLDVSNFKIENLGTGDINVKFDISLSLKDSDESIVLSLLDAAGLSAYYASEISSVKTSLNKLLTCRVQRINMSTGERIDFGVLKNNSLKFSEEELRSDGIKPPVRGEIYRYVISVMAREPETLFSSHREATSNTGRVYKFSPRKFRHPAVLRSGTIYSDNGLKKLLSKSELEFGEIGLFAQQDLNLSNEISAVSNLVLEQFDRNTNRISWNYTGNTDYLDHFIVAKRLTGNQTVVGRVHNIPSDGKYAYYHDFSVPETGVLEYVVTPVFSNYVSGDPKLTNPLLIGGA